MTSATIWTNTVLLHAADCQKVGILTGIYARKMFPNHIFSISRRFLHKECYPSRPSLPTKSLKLHNRF